MMPNGRTPAPLGAFFDKTFEVEVSRDVKYGDAGIGYEPERGARRRRDLTLDIYRPVAASQTLRPALVMAFGGAFHRGSKEADLFEEEGHRNSPVADYCRAFARRGYVAVSIDYRLTEEQPDPGITPTLPPDQPIGRERIDHVRGLLGLPPSTPEMIAAEIEAATDDMASAVHFVRSRAQALGIDPARVAAGGFSAGALMALNAAYAENVPVAAVVALSGRTGWQSLRTHVVAGRRYPPQLTFLGEQDLPGMLAYLDETRGYLAEVGVGHEFVIVPGATHFYPMTARVDRSDGSATDVETRMAEFLHAALGLDELATAGEMPA